MPCVSIAHVDANVHYAVLMGSLLAPGFLVAAPSLLDPPFKRTVVLLVDHRAEGSFGFVVNRPAPVRLRTMLAQMELAEGDSVATDASVLLGGPVATETGWVLFEPRTSTSSSPDMVQISEKLAVTASRELLAALVADRAPERMLLVLGYAGWGAGQLEGEITQGAWIPVDYDERILFDTPFDDRWSGALRSLGIDPARLSVGTISDS
jgi:putative transcriptional regulator